MTLLGKQRRSNNPCFVLKLIEHRLYRRAGERNDYSIRFIKISRKPGSITSCVKVPIFYFFWKFWFLKYYISAAEELHDVDDLLPPFYQRGNMDMEITAKQEIPN